MIDYSVIDKGNALQSIAPQCVDLIMMKLSER